MTEAEGVPLQAVIGHYTPLLRKGEEWEGECPITAHAEPLAVINGKWRCYGCGAHEQHGDDALGFLQALGMENIEALQKLGAGDWTPTLLKPTPKPAGSLRTASRRSMSPSPSGLGQSSTARPLSGSRPSQREAPSGHATAAYLGSRRAATAAAFRC